MLVEMIYETTKSFPDDEKYALVQQLRRCAVSVPSNIAEGSSKRSAKEYVRFLNIAHGSLAEMETQLEIALRLHYIDVPLLAPLSARANEVGRMLNGLINSLEKI